MSRDGAVSEVPASLAMRLRASELLGKSLGAFLERHEVTGPQQTVVLHVNRETAREVIRSTDDEVASKTR